MLKYKLAVAVFGLALLGLSTETQAQFYSGYVYNNNAYMNYALASQRARAAGRKSKSRGAKKHHVTKRGQHGKTSRHRSQSRTRR